MKYLLILFLMFSSINYSQNVIINGSIVDSKTNEPLPNANIRITNTNAGTSSDINGNFQLTIDTIKYSQPSLIVTYVGYNSARFKLSDFLASTKIIRLTQAIIPSQTIIIQSNAYDQSLTPITFNNLERGEIVNDYTMQDFPQLISSMPSTTSYSEGGNGLGYNYVLIRGFDQRRIGVSINGIPQNDPEDQNVYWLDFPDLIANTDYIQVQRGAGSGVFGYPAIGGSINIVTSSFSNTKKMEFSALIGSYNTRKYSASFSSGLIDNKYAFSVNLSQSLSSGYRDKSWIDFKSYYLSAVRFDDNLTTQINLYGGPISDGLAYTGLPKFAVKDKSLRQKNYSYWEADGNNITYAAERKSTEVEGFSQPHFEILNEYKLSDNVTLNSALFLVLGTGYFDYDGSWGDSSYFRITQENGFAEGINPINALIKAQVENEQYGWIPRVKYDFNNGSIIWGAEIRKHQSLHWGSLSYASNLPAELDKDYKYYQYEGGKDILGSFLNINYSLTKNLSLLGELQLSYHKYYIKNEKYLDNEFTIDNLFFNPRFGINYNFQPETRVYFNFAKVSKEPRLKNYYDAAESSGGAVPQFELNSSGEYDFSNPLVKPETMYDFELGSSYNTQDMMLSLNLFYMLFEDEIVKNGEIDRFGQPVTGNIDATQHMGIEFSLNSKLLKYFEVFANVSYSKNIVKDGFYYLSYGDFVSAIDLSDNSISGFPELIMNLNLSFNYAGIYAELKNKYVGKMYSDNYGSKLNEYRNIYPMITSYTDNVNDAYFVSDIYLSYEVNLFGGSTSTKFFGQVNNIFDNLYSSYAIGQEFFPAAERNFLIGLKLGL